MYHHMKKFSCKDRVGIVRDEQQAIISCYNVSYHAKRTREESTITIGKLDIDECLIGGETIWPAETDK